MKTVRLLLMTLALVFLAGNARSEDTAVLVGVGNYKIQDANLPGISYDIQKLREVVTALGYSKIVEIKDQGATAAAVEQKIKEVLTGVGSNDHVLLYFSGHGSQVPDESGDEDDGLDEVLVCHDIAVGNGKLAGGYILDDRIGELLAGNKAKQVLVLIDACHSGTATKSLTAGYKSKFFTYEGMPEGKGAFSVEEAPASSGSQKDNYVALSAAQDWESAIATNQGSFFTLGLHESVMNAKGSGTLTLSQAQREVTDSIKQRAGGVQERIHKPNLSGNTSLASVNLFIRKVDPPGPGGDPGPGGPGTGTMWDELEKLYSQRKYDLTLSTGKTTYNLGDTATYSCKADREGYLNILNVDKHDQTVTVLFPNRLHRENRVSGNTTVSIPAQGDSFVLRARGPVGDNLIVALHTTQPINLYEESQNKDLFAIFSSAEEKGKLKRAIARKDQGAEPAGYGAGKVVVRVVD